MHSIQLKFAKQKLIFYVAQDLDQTIRSNVEQLVNEVAASRIWSVTPPSYIDEIDENGAEVVGGILEIYSALPPNILPIEMDSKNLDDVEALVGAVKKLSEKENLSFEFQLDATFVGAIEDGVIDRVLMDGLLVPWRNHIKGKS
ncbi:hypothetical protein IFT37_19270 [Pseudomonas fluorescens]|uniref:Uncharacterized protein n=1 Tax=Pseudomonas fluorescens TaxID=294 RepID=A0AAE2Q2C7_PSEFL|nr:MULTISPECIES: hypothetical protein [Pseudomonas fluorescens group]MBA1429843.1 hypothetical protein [Pseudomonas orientalis]MBD8147836.1 hypothetical protein [Pseudomonas fluorescens]MBD8177734.1 hypothetical protein [Pseudomonas fluorescens]MBD8272777.1 hypothetical protein [Pseudomonas fluorescens]MBD8747253.1 hypothetical protein [Pseudomonas fluorescens]